MSGTTYPIAGARLSACSPALAGIAYAVLPSLALWAMIGALIWVA